jgi:hypothetical protein
MLKKKYERNGHQTRNDGNNAIGIRGTGEKTE